MDYYITTEKNKLDLNAIHDYLSNRSYWAKDRSFEKVQTSVENSLCFGIINESNKFMGFARIVTDWSVFAYLMDFFILEDYRNLGMGKALLNYIIEYPDLKNVKTIMLATKDAHKLYEKYGFMLTDNAHKFMILRRNS